MSDYIKLSLKHVPKMLKALEEYPKARRFLYFVLALLAFYGVPSFLRAVSDLIK